MNPADVILLVVALERADRMERASMSIPREDVKWGERVKDWGHVGPGPFVTMQELGISSEGIGARAAVERLKGDGHGPAA